jgi:hypothetical protein
MPVRKVRIVQKVVEQNSKSLRNRHKKKTESLKGHILFLLGKREGRPNVFMTLILP